MANLNYTFDAEPNNYFAGSDLSVTYTGDGHTVLVNERDDLLAVNVKDQSTIHDMPAGPREAFDDLGESEAQALYDTVQREYWDWAADLAQIYGFKGVSQAGRSGGWLGVIGTGDMAVSELITPDSEFADARERFLEFAFEVERAIEDEWLPQYYRRLEAASKARHAARPTLEHFARNAWRENPRFNYEDLLTILDALNVRALDRQSDQYGDGRGDTAADLFVRLTDRDPHEVFTFPEDEVPFGRDELWAEFTLVAFKSDPSTEEMPEGVVRLDRLRDNTAFEDAAGNRYWKVADGPVQGAVVITDGEHFQSWDCGMEVKELG